MRAPFIGWHTHSFFPRQFANFNSSLSLSLKDASVRFGENKGFIFNSVESLVIHVARCGLEGCSYLRLVKCNVEERGEFELISSPHLIRGKWKLDVSFYVGDSAASHASDEGVKVGEKYPKTLIRVH